MSVRRTRVTIWVIAAVVACLCMVPVKAQAASTAKVYMTVTQDYAKAQTTLQFINKERAKRGLKTLKLDKNLTNSAVARAAEVSVMVPLTSPHKRPNGKLVKTINKRISYECAAESFGYAPKQIVKMWMNSPPHKRGILLKSARSVGISAVTTVDGYQIWTLEFSGSKAKSVVKSKGKKTFTKKVPAKKKLLKKSCFKIRNASTMTAGKKSTAKVIYDGSKTYGPGLAAAKSFKWSSSNKAVATVNKNGVITAKKAGTVTIKAKMKTGYKFTLKKKITVKPAPPKALTEAQILANRQKLIDYVVSNGYMTDEYGSDGYRLDMGAYRKGGSTNSRADGENFLVAFPDYNEVRLYRMETVIKYAAGSDPQLMWDIGAYVRLYADELDDPLYEYAVTATEGTGADAEETEDYWILGYIDRANFNADTATYTVELDDEINGEYDAYYEDDYYDEARDFLSDMAGDWPDCFAIYAEDSGLNMYKLGFPAMK